MIVSKTVYQFEPRVVREKLLLFTRSWPWSVLQIVPTTPDSYEEVVARCRKRGMVGLHDTDRTFCVIRTAGGDLGGKRPECKVDVFTQPDADRLLAAIADELAQAAVWFHANKSALCGR